MAPRPESDSRLASSFSVVCGSSCGLHRTSASGYPVRASSCSFCHNSSNCAVHQSNDCVSYPPAVCATLVVQCISPAPAVHSAPDQVVKYTSQAPAVRHAAPASAGYAATAPAVKYISPAQPVTHASPTTTMHAAPTTCCGTHHSGASKQAMPRQPLQGMPQQLQCSGGMSPTPAVSHASLCFRSISATSPIVEHIILAPVASCAAPASARYAATTPAVDYIWQAPVDGRRIASAPHCPAPAVEHIYLAPVASYAAPASAGYPTSLSSLGVHLAGASCKIRIAREQIQRQL